MQALFSQCSLRCYACTRCQSLGGHPLDEIRAVSRRVRSPSLPRVLRRLSPSLLAIATIALVTGAAACDTGDGKEMRAPTSDQRANQPTTARRRNHTPSQSGIAPAFRSPAGPPSKRPNPASPVFTSIHPTLHVAAGGTLTAGTTTPSGFPPVPLIEPDARPGPALPDSPGTADPRLALQGK